MRLTVLNVAYPFAPVGPDAVGGAEQVLTHLDEALVRAGEDSLVLACAGSKARGRLFSHSVPEGPLDVPTRQTMHRSYRRALQSILEHHAVDLIHMHGIDFASYLPDTDVPVLVTLHLPLEWYPAAGFASKKTGLFFHCVSASQSRNYHGCAQLLPEIENGVPEELFSVRARKEKRVVALGRICPEKGFHHALNAAKAADISMTLAGRVFPYPEHEAYFASRIIPLLDETRRFIGPVGYAAKKQLLASSSALLAPSLVKETSSLVAMETLACGTPVIAFPAGALADIVEHGVTGFLVTNEAEMAGAIEEVHRLSPARCRARARQRFSLARSSGAYLDLYRRLVAEHRIHDYRNPFLHGINQFGAVAPDRAFLAGALGTNL